MIGFEHKQGVDSSPKFLFPAQSARSKFEAPSGGDCYPEEKRLETERVVNISRNIIGSEK